MKSLPAFILVFVMAVTTRADETLYRYEGDVHPLDPSAGWVMGNPCDPPCSEFLEDGHFVRLWSVAGDFASYAFWIAQPPDPPPTLWVEWRFRSNFPLGPIFDGCDASFLVQYQGIADLPHGDAHDRQAFRPIARTIRGHRNVEPSHQEGDGGLRSLR